MKMLQVLTEAGLEHIKEHQPLGQGVFHVPQP